MDQPLLSVIVGTIDRPQHIANCIESVRRHTTIPYELIVGDASERHPPLVSSGPLRVVREKPRLGHAKGYNQLFRQARGKWVCWLNDDARVTPGWANNAVAFMEYTPWVGLGCFYYSEHGCCFHLSQYQDFIYANFGILSKQFGDRIGWFDECVRMYGADNSITFKTILAGKGVSGIPGAKIMHEPISDDIRRGNMAGQKSDEKALLDKYRPFMWEMKKSMARLPQSPLRIP
jgi:GT2 family glycosyltransferase